MVGLVIRERLDVGQVLKASRAALVDDQVVDIDERNGQAADVDRDPARPALLEGHTVNACEEVDPFGWVSQLDDDPGLGEVLLAQAEGAESEVGEGCDESPCVLPVDPDRDDAEVFSALARLHREGTLPVGGVDARIRALSRMNVLRLPITGALLQEAWTLRHNVAARDTLYVALARRLRGKLLTTDQRLARAVPELVV